jgi:hypothetical protein
MTCEFVETSRFAAKRDAYFGGDEGYLRFQLALAEQPRRGDVIPGTGGIRKMRWQDVSRQKGRRGGLRIIYLYVEEAANILLLVVYDKDVAVDLRPDEKRILAEYAHQYRTELMQRKRDQDDR